MKDVVAELWLVLRWLLLKGIAALASLRPSEKFDRVVIHVGNMIFRRKYPAELFDGYESYINKFGSSLDQYNKLLGHCEWPRNRTILDIGSGLGQYSVLLARNGARSVVGLEIQHPKSAFALRRWSSEKVRFVTGTANALPFSDCQFDAVFSHTVFEHIERLHETLTSISRILKDDGVAVLSFNFLHHRGGHHLHPYIHFPWATWVVSERSLCRYWSACLKADQSLGRMGFFEKGVSLETLSDGSEIHLNRWNCDQFESAVVEAGLLVYKRQTSEALGRLFPVLLKTRLRPFLSGTIYYVLKKATVIDERNLSCAAS